MFIALVALLVAFAAALTVGAQDKAPEQKFVAILIWGTDGEKFTLHIDLYESYLEEVG